MVLSDENEEQMHKKLLELCNKMNLDPKTVNTAWGNFQSINKNYVLEVSLLQLRLFTDIAIFNFEK